MTDDYTDDLDALADVPVDEGEIAQGRKDALVPAGWYTTDPEQLAVTVGKSEKTGRPYARAFGVMTGPEEGRVGFSWSWQRANRREESGEDTGKPDGMYRNYMTLVGLYEKSVGAKPKTVREVNEFVGTTPLQVRVIQTRQDDNMVVALRLPPA